MLPTVSRLDHISAAQLLLEHRQVDLDAFPLDAHIARDTIGRMPAADPAAAGA